MSASPLVEPQDQAGMLRDLSDRLTLLEQTSIVPVGLIAHCRGAVPNGWLYADGSAFDSARYGQLAAYLGSAVLPDLTGTFIVGKDTGTFLLVGATGGVENVTLTAAQSGSPAHTHPAPTITIGNEAAHTHGPASGGSFIVAAGATSSVSPTGGSLNATTSTGPGSSHTHTGTSGAVPASSAVAASSSHTNLPPYIVLYPIIKF